MQLRETKTKPEKQGIGKGKAYLAGEGGPARGAATTRSKQSRLPDRACWGSRGQDHPTNHSNTTHVVNQCGVKPQDD